MPENQIENKIIEDLENAKKTENFTPEKVYEIFKNVICHALKEDTEKQEQVRPILKEAVMTAVKLFMDNKEEEENLSHAVKGIMDGMSIDKVQAIDAMEKEINKLKEKIKIEQKKLSFIFQQGAESISEVEDTLNEDIKKIIESVLSDIRSKYKKSSEINKQSIKDAVTRAIESGVNIKDTVVEITRDATKKAFEQGKLKASMVKEVTEKILSGAVDAAEEAGKNINDVTNGAFKGIQEGMASMADSITDTTREFIREDLSKTKDDLKTIKSLFLETVSSVGKSSGKTAKKILDDLVNQSKKAGSTLKEETDSTAEKLTGKLKNIGKEAIKTFGSTGEKATSMVTGEVKKLGKKSIKVATGGIKGMWQGAKEALKNEENDQ